MSKSGIYGIFNCLCGKVYIGSSISLRRRRREHEKQLREQKHFNDYLQKAWNKYGEDSFKFYIIEYCQKGELLEREQFFINLCKSYDDEFGYNICKESASTIGQKPWLGKKHTKETREKISASNIGKHVMTEEKKRILSIANKGRIPTDEFRQKLSIMFKGRIVSDETKRKMAESAMGNKKCIGRVLSDETKRKISLANKVRFTDPLIRQKYSEIHKGKIVSVETRLKLSIINKGKSVGFVHSAESKAKMSEALKLSWQKRKQKLLIGG